MSTSYAVILANPERADLRATRVEAVARALRSDSAVDWLAPGIAAQIPLSAAPVETLSARIGDGQRAEGFDFAVVPAANRRKRLFLADMDSTMIEEECIDELAAMAGAGAEVAAITARAMNGELDFADALRARVALLKELPTKAIGEVLDERIHLASGGAALMARLRAAGVYTALLSGGFTDFTAVIAAKLGFDEHRANRLLADQGALTGQVAEPIFGKAAKLEALQTLVAAKGLTPDDVLAVGDGANDLPMLLAAGMGVALHAKPAVAAAAPYRLDHADLTGLLYLQGYRTNGCR